MKDLATASAANLGVGFAFGVKPANTAAALRYLADEIDAGHALPQDIRHTSYAPQDDFTLQTLVVRFAVKGPVDAKD